MSGENRDFVVVFCDQHRKRRVVARYLYLDDRWVEYRQQTAAQRRNPPDPDTVTAEIAAHLDEPFTSAGELSQVLLEGRARVALRPTGDSRPGHHVASNEMDIAPHIRMGATARAVFPNRCDRCQANYPRRAESMAVLLDLISDAGQRAVSLRQLAAVGRKVDTP